MHFIICSFFLSFEEFLRSVHSGGITIVEEQCQLPYIFCLECSLTEVQLYSKSS